MLNTQPQAGASISTTSYGGMHANAIQTTESARGHAHNGFDTLASAAVAAEPCKQPDPVAAQQIPAHGCSKQTILQAVCGRRQCPKQALQRQNSPILSTTPLKTLVRQPHYLSYSPAAAQHRPGCCIVGPTKAANSARLPKAPHMRAHPTAPCMRPLEPHIDTPWPCSTA